MTTISGNDRLTGTSAAAALATAAKAVNIETDDARLLRLGENALFDLPHQGIVVRIARSEALKDRVTREIAMARWLEDLHFPAIRVAPLPQVVPAEGRLVTFWQRAEEVSGEKTLTDLGAMLRHFHALPEPPFHLPVFDPFQVVPSRLTQAESTPDVRPADLAFLRERLDELTDAYSALSFALPQGLIHGDAHRSNLLKSPEGILLLDFEVVAFGPREWDLTPTALAHERFGLSADEYADFVTAYGEDVTTWDGYRTMANMRELTMTTWLMQNVSEAPEIATEFTARVADMRSRDFSRRWRSF